MATMGETGVSHAPPQPTPCTLHDQVAEAKRELGLRRSVYPRWVADGRMNQQTAARRLALQEAIVATLTALACEEQERQDPRLL